MFNLKFGTFQSKQSIISICSTLKYKCSNDGKFQKGQVPWSKGLAHDEYMSHIKNESLENIKKGQFGYGRKRDSGYPIGTELWRNGYLMVKISNDKNIPCHKRWKFKHIIVWETHYNKKVPKGYIVIFKNMDNTDFRIENLLLISRKQNAVMASHGTHSSNPEITQIGANIAEILLISNGKEKHMESEEK